jgi:hypothetical protein
MVSNLVWYAGTCIKRPEHDKPAQLEAAAQQVNGVWKLIENREAIFKHLDRLELRAIEARNLRTSEWVAFTMAPTGPKSKVWQAAQQRRLFWYADFSIDGGNKQTQRRLMTEGVRTTHPSGAWIVRCSNDEVLLLDLKQQDGAAHLAVASSKVLAYSFNPKAVTGMPTADGEFQLYDLDNAAIKASYDWTGDDAFALRVARGAASAGDVAARGFIPWLESFARQGQTLLSIDQSDVAFAYDAIRSGQLAKRLAEDQALLRGFVDAFATDERIGGLIKSHAAQVAEQERQAAQIRADAVVAQEITARRAKKLRELELDFSSIVMVKSAELEADHSQQLEQLAEEMNHQRTAAEERLQDAVEARRSAVENALDELEERREALSQETTQLATANLEAQRQLDSLSTATGAANASLRAIRCELSEVEASLSTERATLTVLQTKCPSPLTPEAATAVSLVRFGKKIEASKLLSPGGKKSMLQFVALMLAGEAPALSGAGVSDFLAVAETMLASGRAVRMEADPTLITFEDLWVRPGAGVSTALGHALRSAAGAAGEPRTNLAIIERAEQSGARFWYPQLLNCAQRGDLPRRLMICTTVQDADCQEALAIFVHAVRLHIDGALAPGAGVVLAMANSRGVTDELDPDDAPADLAMVLPEFIADADALDAVRTGRAMRAFAQAQRIDSKATASTFIELFSTVGETVDNKLWSNRHA